MVGNSEVRVPYSIVWIQFDGFEQQQSCVVGSGRRQQCFGPVVEHLDTVGRDIDGRCATREHFKVLHTRVGLQSAILDSGGCISQMQWQRGRTRAFDPAAAADTFSTVHPQQAQLSSKNLHWADTTVVLPSIRPRERTHWPLGQTQRSPGSTQ